MAVVSARQRTRGIVMISVLIFLMWVGYAMIMTPVSKLLLQRECHHLNISENAPQQRVGLGLNKLINILI